MIEIIKFILSNEKLMPLGLAGISAFALGMALTAEHVFGLLPCNLCVIQRWPYAIVIALGLIGFFVSSNPKATVGILGAISLTFLINSGVAFYHSGVERKWWKSFLEGCNVPNFTGTPTEIMEQIKAAPVVRCDEIPWADPILGLSMANYNVVFCLGLAVISGMSAVLVFRKNISKT